MTHIDPALVMRDDEDTHEQVILRGWTDDGFHYAIYDVRQPDGSYVRRIAGLSEENYAKALAEKQGEAR